MKRFISSIIVLILILGGSYFAMTKYAPQYKSEVDEALNKLVDFGEEFIEKNTDKADEQSIAVIFNSNSDSNIPLVVTSADKNSLTAFSKIIFRLW